jgi:RadC-like JAB domain-containing protein
MRDCNRQVLLVPAGSLRGWATRPPSEADLRLTRRIAEAARLLQIALLDHVIAGMAGGKQPYFSFREAGILVPKYHTLFLLLYWETRYAH